MRKTYSSEQLESFTYNLLNDGNAVVHLRDNIDFIEGTDGEEGTWVADEVVTTTDLPESEVADNFDALWVKSETEAKPVTQRLSELEELSDAMMAIILGEE